MFLSLFYSMGKVMTSRGLKNCIHITGTLLAVLLYFAGYFSASKQPNVAVVLIILYIILGRITSELMYRTDRRLLEEKVAK